MFMRKQEVGCLAHNNRNVIQSIIDSINCTSTRVRDVALQVQGQAVAGELVTRGERLRGKVVTAVRSTTTSCETAFEPVKA